MQTIGGGGQPLSYTTPNAYEPSAREGGDLLGSSGTVVRPGLPIKGGFMPSVMGNFVQNAPLLIPLATTAAYRMMSNKTRKLKGGFKDWETLRYEAKRDLSLIGKASAVNINRLASIRKRGESNAAFIEDFTARKAPNTLAAPVVVNNVLTSVPKVVKEKKAKKTVKIKVPAGLAAAKWQQNKQKAKDYLSRLGKASGPNIAAYASMLRKGENTTEFLDHFQSRTAAAAPAPAPKPKAKAVVVPRAPSARTVKAVAPPSVTAAITASLAKIKAGVAKSAAPSLLPLPEPPQVKVKEKKKRVEGAKGTAWKENRQRAKEFLLQHGRPTGQNMSRFASIRRKGNADAESEFIASFKSRFLEEPAPRRTEQKEAEVVEVDDEEEEETAPVSAPVSVSAPTKTRVTSSASIDQWKLNRQRAKELLQRIGSATAAEISKLASMMRSGTDTSDFLTSVKNRVNQTRRRLTMLKQKKDLSAVQEVNNENEVHEYTLPSQNTSVPQQQQAKQQAQAQQQPNNVTRKAPIENFRKHLQLLKQKLQREKV